MNEIKILKLLLNKSAAIRPKNSPNNFFENFSHQHDIYFTNLKTTIKLRKFQLFGYKKIIINK